MSDQSGRLTVVRGGWERRLDFLDGRVVYASSTLPHERLATHLASKGLLDAARLRRLLAISLLRRTLFTDLLVDQDGVSVDDLRAHLQGLAQTITTRVFGEAELDVSFDPTYPVRNLLHLDLNLDPQTLALEAARRTDETGGSGPPDVRDMLPLAGDAFERFFFDLIAVGVPEQDPLDGESFAALHRVVRDVMITLGQWLTSGPGLVPLPPEQVRSIDSWPGGGGVPPLDGMPHAVWNQMVLACAVRAPDLERPATLTEAADVAQQLGVWGEMTGSDRWRRPAAGRLDELSRTVVASWTRAAEAAAEALGVEPGRAGLAVHLMAIPSDLVLWVLATVAVPHNGVRLSLLREVPRRLARELGALGDLPPWFQRLAAATEPHRLGLALDLARRALPSATVWPATMPETQDPSTSSGVREDELEAARARVREALEET